MKKWAIHSVSPSLFRQVRSAVKRLDTTPLVVKLATYHPNPLYWMHTSDNVAEKSHSRWFLSTFCASLGIERDTLRRRFTTTRPHHPSSLLKKICAVTFIFLQLLQCRNGPGNSVILGKNRIIRYRSGTLVKRFLTNVTRQNLFKS